MEAAVNMAKPATNGTYIKLAGILAPLILGAIILKNSDGLLVPCYLFNVYYQISRIKKQVYYA